MKPCFRGLSQQDFLGPSAGHLLNRNSMLPQKTTSQARATSHTEPNEPNSEYAASRCRADARLACYRQTGFLFGSDVRMCMVQLMGHPGSPPAMCHDRPSPRRCTWSGRISRPCEKHGTCRASTVEQQDATLKHSHTEGGRCARNDCVVVDFAPQVSTLVSHRC